MKSHTPIEKAVADEAVARAFAKMEDARPRSGFRPETPEEWHKLAAAVWELFAEGQIAAGVDPVVARALSMELHASPLGWLVLDLAFRETSHG